MFQSTGDDGPEVPLVPNPEKSPSEEAAAIVCVWDAPVLLHKLFPRLDPGDSSVPLLETNCSGCGCC